MTASGVRVLGKRVVRAVLARAGLEVRRVGRSDPGVRASLGGALLQLRTLGWEPETCLDVGAAFGDFTLACAPVFPRAQYLMVEPLVEYRPHLENVGKRLPRAIYAPFAAAARAGEATLHVHADVVGSSFLRETEGGGVDGATRTVTTATVDGLCHAHGAVGPYLLKADVQGAELDVLEGATETLARTEYVLLEISLLQFFIGGPELPAVVAFMATRGFVPYDVFGLKYRPLDGALAQLDMAFVRDSGAFRRHHAYATVAQRAAQNAKFAAVIQRNRRRLEEKRS